MHIFSSTTSHHNCYGQLPQPFIRHNGITGRHFLALDHPDIATSLLLLSRIVTTILKNKQEIAMEMFILLLQYIHHCDGTPLVSFCLHIFLSAQLLK